ncbi:conserved hypothetical protein [uncultured Desulfobacterium sp.]|uniref:Lipoprotein n=1 Tax=uncultured Desulfobacterium sp. TaxID=201089 RepID=A0A445MW55_9BACT|nr:conserved hypothetical protein [uncultured Desulfobacterium sp.]
MEHKAIGRLSNILVHLLWFSAMSLCLISCGHAPFYSISLQYVPQQDVIDNDIAPVNAIFAVAGFQDNRSWSNKALVGKRLMSGGSEVDVTSQFEDANHAVVSAIKEYLKRLGYTVREDIADWDLDSDSFPADCGEFIIGGSIEELGVVCRSSLFQEKYEARVKLNIVFGDVRQKKILYRSTIEGSSELKHISFSAERVQQELNNALSAVVEKILDLEMINQAL